MELLIGIAVIFILLLCLGATFELIAMVALAIIGLFIVFMAAVFIYSLIVMLTSKRTTGEYSRFETEERSKLPYAFYKIDDTEYKNLFPMEVIFKRIIYKKEKTVKLLFNKKVNRCIDANAMICCVFGFLVSSFLIFEMVTLILKNI